MRTNSEQRARDWADRAWDDRHDDAREPVYPDGSVRHECWDPASLKRKRPAAKPAPDAKKDRMSEDTRPECF